MSIAQIAAAAGVSKGGLLHHFGSRDGLVLALAEDINTRFRDEVHTFLDLSENRPGKMLRAYVRALCGGSTAAMSLFTYTLLWPALARVPEVVGIIRDDDAYWERTLLEDGLHPQRVLVVRRAAEGVAAAAGTDSPAAQDEVHVARDLLLRLTEDSQPLVP